MDTRRCVVLVASVLQVEMAMGDGRGGGGGSVRRGGELGGGMLEEAFHWKRVC